MDNLLERTYSFKEALVIGIPLTFLLTVPGLFALTIFFYCRSLVRYWCFLEKRTALSYIYAVKKMVLINRLMGLPNMIDKSSIERDILDKKNWT